MNPNNNTTSYTSLYNRFVNVWLRDPTNLTWTAPECTDLLLTAFNDPYVNIIDFDSSTLTVANQPQYPVPGQFITVTDVSIDAAGDGYWVPLDSSDYQVINGQIIFTRFNKMMPAGKTLAIYGVRPLTTADSIPFSYQEYILHQATAEAFELLKSSLTSRFVKNDVTMAGIIQSIQTHRQQAQYLRTRLGNNYAVTT